MNTYVTGTTVRELREKQNMTQAELAEKIGVSSKTISKWETAKGLPDITLLQPLAQALGISVIELLNGECVTNQNISGKQEKHHFIERVTDHVDIDHVLQFQAPEQSQQPHVFHTGIGKHPFEIPLADDKNCRNNKSDKHHSY